MPTAPPSPPKPSTPPAALRTPYWPGDSAVGLHALASLIARAQQMIPAAVSQARDQGHTRAEIGQLLNLTPGNRSTPIPQPSMIHLTQITHIMIEQPPHDFL